MSDETVEPEEAEEESGDELDGATAATENHESADDSDVDEAPVENEHDDATAEVEEPQSTRFSFVKELGHGVLGEAHKVIDEVTGEPVVLKIFARARPSRPEAFKLEFEALSRLKHPSLVRFHHLVDPASDTNIAVESVVGETGLAFTQDFVDGLDLTQWLARPITEQEREALEERRAPVTGEVPRDPITGDLVEDSDALESGEVATQDVADGDQETSSDELAREPETNDVERELEEADPSTAQSIAYAETLEMGRSEEASQIIEEIAREPEPPSMDLKLFRLERLLPQIVEGLRHLHKFQKVHGALRPSNVLVGRDDKALLTDYGIVPELVYRRPGKEEDDEAAEVSFLEAPENIPFLAPEVMKDGFTQSADLYALGCVLFEAIAETSAFDALEWSGGKSPTLQPPPLAELVPECPATWAEVVDGLLKRNPDERPSLGMVLEVVGSPGAKAVSVPPTVVAAPDLFIGRSDEMEALKEIAHVCSTEGRISLVMLEGETGAGKSTLARALGHHLARRGWLVIQDRCYQRESVVYQGWHQVAATIAEMIESLPLAIREEIESEILAAAHLFPVIAGGRELSGEVSRFRAISALRHLLKRLSEERPILLCLENLHWASWDTSSLLIDLFSDDEGIRLLTVATWGTDAPREGSHMLRRDLALALVDVAHFPIRGFGKEDAREYAVTAGAHLEVDELKGVLRTANMNPRLLEELVNETEETREAADEAGRRNKDATTQAVLETIYQHRLEQCGPVQRAVVNLVSVASGPLNRKLLMRALETEVGAAKLTSERGNLSNEALEGLLKDGLVEKLAGNTPDAADRFIVGHDIVRRVVLKSLSEREHARYAGRIADALGVHDPKNVDLRFEYELRAGRVGRAMENAADAARRAEARYAYHRAAKLWRWLVEHREDMPTYSRWEPADELARVELLAGRHDDAAQLFRQRAERSKSPIEKAEVRLMEARAWLQAGQVDAAIEAMHDALRLTGARYKRGLFEGVRDASSILSAAISRWNADAPEKLGGPAKKRYRVRAQIAYFGAVHAPMLDTTRRDHMGAVLVNIAERTGDPLLLGMERIILSNYRWRPYDEGRQQAETRRLDDADRLFRHIDEQGWRAQVGAERASMHLRHDDMAGAAVALKHAFDVAERAEGDGFDRRFALFVQALHALRQGNLSSAERSARRCLHVYRGDRIAESRAYEILARSALLQGEVERAGAFIETGSNCMKASEPNLDTINWARLKAQLDIALGRPEVAVRNLELLREKLSRSRLLGIGAAATSLELGLGQALAAHTERQRTFGDPRVEDSLQRLREVRKRLERFVDSLAPVPRAEVLRLFARIELLRNRTKRALRDLEVGAQVMATTHAPIDVAKSAEARGHVLLKREQPEARTVMEQAWDLYDEHGCQFPLILEGWPIPAQISALREEA